MGFDPLEFLETAVETPSHETVEPMRALLCDHLAANGAEPTVHDDGSVLASKGNSSGPHIVLNTHLDTVAPHVPAEREGDVLHGRGSCDAKGPLAAMLSAFLDCEPDGTLTLAVTPDEERRSHGAAALVPSLDLDGERGDAVIVGEPTGLDVCIAGKGRFEGTVRVEGENAHAAEPHTGTNAITGAAAAIEAIDEFGERPDALSAHPDLGRPTLTPTVVEGGTATNQVPAGCEIVVDRRSVPPETAADFERDLDDFLRERLDSSVSFALTERETPFLEAFETPADSGVVEAFQDAGCDTRPFTAATEASYFAREAPTVVFGPGDLADADGPVAHAEREYVRLPEVERATELLDRVLASLFRRTGT
ncbi:M20/M25/M40 family metallo-hydrolase [Halococcus thailandensis]|uniref:Succinyl-diaminopimelate desuccinylase n=1 Tax=Halococcus thailandensis JCM 13552 TaxID=1227457 RepID=M0MZ45_9EURY|nr:M20/M25/M40 family metallo-hydrolase [Halococcus thailandensis]EMA49685.1 succinyl-diaminopimelate desuccinylase [Halococcus thailandensis JCM 13552]